MKRLPKTVPIIIVGLWCGLVALGLALAAFAAAEPPVWDALSYVQKSYNFWEAIKSGRSFNPFDLPMTIRPPGTVLMSYPFGWSDNYHWFYFRACFIPILLLIAAVYIAGWTHSRSQSENWVLAGLALALVGMPMLYQFQSNEAFPSTASWGLVDSFLAGVGAIAAAAALRSVSSRSKVWALVSAASAGFCFWIKPSGVIMMALAGVAWLILAGSAIGWSRQALRRDPDFRRFAIRGLAGAAVILVLFAGLGLRSEYFSAGNIAFGRRTLEIFDSEFNPSLTLDMAIGLTRLSFGWAVPSLVLLGLIMAALAPVKWGSFVAALFCLVGGLWFWLGETEVTQIRYFLPFGIMAFILLIPCLMEWANRLRAWVVGIGMAAAAAQALIVAALLVVPNPPQSVQSALGINLHANSFQAENEQAADLVRRLALEGVEHATVYLAGTSAALRNLQAVWDYEWVTRRSFPAITGIVPTDWQRSTTVRAEELLRSDFIAIEPIADPAAREAILSRKDVADFESLRSLFSAWASGLGEADGITLVSKTRVQLIRISDRTRFEAALTHLEESYNLPQSYRDANPRRWWTASEVAARKGASAVEGMIAFNSSTPGEPVRNLMAVDIAESRDGLRAQFWFKSEESEAQDSPWYIFAHLVDASGNIVKNAQAELFSGRLPFSDRPARYYSVTYPDRPATAVAMAFGIYRPVGDKLEFLMPDRGVRDWDNRRVILPLPASR